MMKRTALLFLLAGTMLSCTVTDGSENDVVLYSPGDYDSANWRIPAITSLPDGTLLVVNDKRKFNESDLPNDIDVVSRFSTDGGRTWSEPLTIAEGKGEGKGYGDPALAVASDGTVVCTFAGGAGTAGSCLEDPIRCFIVTSHDGGHSWSELSDITSLIWGPDAVNPALTSGYRGAFCSSGNGLVLRRGAHKGRILFAAVVSRDVEGYEFDNFIIYSDDGGCTWNVSDKAFTGADEAKMVELVDGSVLLSVRQNGARGMNVSSDGGETWGEQSSWPEMTVTACNGEIIRYSAVDEGGKENILLHSVCNSMKRENLCIFASYDEGRTWVNPKTVYAGGAAYSSMTVLQNGNVGIYFEETDTFGGESRLIYREIPKKWLFE